MRYDNFEDFPIWQNAREIVNMVYNEIEKSVKLKNDFRLSSQLIGASVSILNNIAEGFDSDNNKEFVRFLIYSQRSCSELMSMSYILKDVYHLTHFSEDLYSKCLEERKQIKGFIKYLRKLK